MDEQWSHAPLFIHFPITRSSRELLLVTCGCTTDPSLKNCGGNVTKREKLWLRVNLTRSHNTKQPLILHYLVVSLFV